MPLYDFQCDRCGATRELLAPSGQPERGRHYCAAEEGALPKGMTSEELDSAFKAAMRGDPPADLGPWGTWKRSRFPAATVPPSGRYSYGGRG